MPTSLGVNFGRDFLGNLKPWKNKAEKYSETKNRHQKSLRNSPALFLNFARPIVGVLRGNTIRGNKTRNSERKMAL